MSIRLSPGINPPPDHPDTGEAFEVASMQRLATTLEKKTP